jgi:hypothetical protein
VPPGIDNGSWSSLRPRQGIFEKPGKNSLSLKQLAGLFKNTLARPAPHTRLAETHDQRPIIKRILKKAGRPVMLLQLYKFRDQRVSIPLRIYPLQFNGVA